MHCARVSRVRPIRAPIRAHARDAPWRRRCCPSAPCAPCRASCSGLQRRASGPSVNQRRAAACAGHALNTMMGCPPMVILDDGARRVVGLVAHSKRHPLHKRRKTRRGGRLHGFAPPGIAWAPAHRPPARVPAAVAQQLPGTAARRTLLASPRRRLRPLIAPRPRCCGLTAGAAAAARAPARRPSCHVRRGAAG